jgi:hypothetical protein
MDGGENQGDGASHIIREKPSEMSEPQQARKPDIKSEPRIYRKPR